MSRVGGRPGELFPKQDHHWKQDPGVQVCPGLQAPKAAFSQELDMRVTVEAPLHAGY